MSKYVCAVCGYVYDESAGILENGIAPDTAWSDLPEKPRPTESIWLMQKKQRKMESKMPLNYLKPHLIRKPYTL